MIREEREKSQKSGDSQKVQKQYEDSIQLLKNQLKDKEKEVSQLKVNN
jgi:hypothetical protein